MIICVASAPKINSGIRIEEDGVIVGGGPEEYKTSRELVIDGLVLVVWDVWRV